MMEVLIYVEGASDRLAMNELLKDLIVRQEQRGITIRFVEAPPGDKKASVMRKVPVRAVNILRNKSEVLVVAMPDLYPYNKELPHESFPELEACVMGEFKRALSAKGITDAASYLRRFRVFCFKHDLEALVLAAKEALELRLGTDHLLVKWHIPVEDQNNDRPPKRIVEALFTEHGQRYSETVDAPLVLGMSDYQAIADACPQCFKPFIEFLERLTIDGSSHPV